MSHTVLLQGHILNFFFFVDWSSVFVFRFMSFGLAKGLSCVPSTLICCMQINWVAPSLAAPVFVSRVFVEFRGYFLSCLLIAPDFLLVNVPCICFSTQIWPGELVEFGDILCGLIAVTPCLTFASYIILMAFYSSSEMLVIIFPDHLSFIRDFLYIKFSAGARGAAATVVALCDGALIDVPLGLTKFALLFEWDRVNYQLQYWFASWSTCGDGTQVKCRQWRHYPQIVLPGSGYKAFHLHREDRRGRGQALIYKTSIEVQYLPLSVQNHSTETALLCIRDDQKCLLIPFWEALFCFRPSTPLIIRYFWGGWRLRLVFLEQQLFVGPRPAWMNELSLWRREMSYPPLGRFSTESHKDRCHLPGS